MLLNQQKGSRIEIIITFRLRFSYIHPGIIPFPPYSNYKISTEPGYTISRLMF